MVAGAVCGLIWTGTPLPSWVLIPIGTAGWMAWLRARHRLTVVLLAVSFLGAGAVLGSDARDRALRTPLRALLDREIGGFSIETPGPGRPARPAGCSRPPDRGRLAGERRHDTPCVDHVRAASRRVAWGERQRLAHRRRRSCRRAGQRVARRAPRRGVRYVPASRPIPQRRCARFRARPGAVRDDAVRIREERAARRRPGVWERD